MTVPDLAGATPALPTPLSPRGDVDLEVAAALVRRAIAHDAAAVLVGGSTGEGPLVPAEERARFTAAAVEVGGETPVLACASGAAVADVQRDVERLAAAGAAAVLVLAPTYFPLTDEETVDLQWLVADTSPVPVLAYHIPQLTRAPLTEASVRRLATHPNVMGMKDSSGDTPRLRRFLAAADGQDFVVLQGAAPELRAALEAGATGSITAIANVLPDEVMALHRAVADDDEVEAAAAQQRLSRGMAALAAVPGPTSSAVKAALEHAGVLPSGTPWPPLRAVDEEQVTRLVEALAGLDELETLG